MNPTVKFRVFKREVEGASWYTKDANVCFGNFSFYKVIFFLRGVFRGKSCSIQLIFYLLVVLVVHPVLIFLNWCTKFLWDIFFHGVSISIFGWTVLIYIEVGQALSCVQIT